MLPGGAVGARGSRTADAPAQRSLARWAALPPTPTRPRNSTRAQIENPVRVLPMARFCVGNRAAALSTVKHAPDVQHAIEAGLLAAAAAGADDGGDGGGGDGAAVPAAVPPADAVQRMRAVQSGYFEKGGLRPLPATASPPLAPRPPAPPQTNGQGLAGRPPLPAPPAVAMKRSE